MIDWNLVLQYAFSNDFQAIFHNKWRKGYVDSQIKKAKVKFPNFSKIAWAQASTHTKSKANTQCHGKVAVKVYQWRGKKPQQKMMLMITKNGDFVGIIDQGITMMYVANIEGHPIVVTDQVVFRNSDGSTQVEVEQEILTGGGDAAVKFILTTGKKFIEDQIH